MTDYERNYTTDYGGTAGRTGVAEDASEGAAAGDHGVRARAREMGNRARSGAGEMGSRANGLYDDHPLVVGAGVALLGVLIGMVLPRTRPEDRMMGKASGRVSDMARGKADELRGAAQRTFERAADTARDELDQHGLTPDDLKGKASEARDAAKSVAEETKNAAKEEAGKVRGQSQGGGQGNQKGGGGSKS